MKIEVKLKPPMMPNFISYEQPIRRRQDGVADFTVGINVSELTEEQAKEYGELMKQTFINHWQTKKNSVPTLTPARITMAQQKK